MLSKPWIYSRNTRYICFCADFVSCYDELNEGGGEWRKGDGRFVVEPCISNGVVQCIGLEPWSNSFVRAAY